MKIVDKALGGVTLISSEKFYDSRGAFQQLIDNKMFDLIEAEENSFCLTYYSVSKKNVIRGLHYQVNTLQDKFISILSGSVFDVVVDLRKDSSSFGQHKSFDLHQDHNNIIWIPAGYAHGFQSIQEDTIMLYMCTGRYSPQDERCINYLDKDLKINWPNISEAKLSKKDLLGISFSEAQYF